MAVAKSLDGLLDDPTVKRILDRTQEMRGIVGDVLELNLPNLDERNPSSVLFKGDRGGIAVTDLDLFAMIGLMAQDRGVVNIPQYGRLRSKATTSDTIEFADDNRHGEVIGLVSHRSRLTQSVRIIDYQRGGRRRGTVGRPRTFCLVNDYGDLYNLVEGIEWFPEEGGREGIVGKLNGDTSAVQGVSFKHFVHPLRRVSLYGQPYLTARLLSDRIDDQAAHYRSIAAQLEVEGFKLDIRNPQFLRRIDFLYDHESVNEKNKQDCVRVDDVMDVETRLLIEPGFEGKYPNKGFAGFTHEGKPWMVTLDPEKKIEDMDDREKQFLYNYTYLIGRELTYVWGPKVRVIKRANELAFFKYGFKGNSLNPGDEHKPPWEVPDWQPGFRIPRSYQQRKRKDDGTLEPTGTDIHTKGPVDWNMMRFNDHFALLYRIRTDLVSWVNPAAESSKTITLYD